MLKIFFIFSGPTKKKTKYMLDGNENDVTFRIEEIKVKGGKSIIDT